MKDTKKMESRSYKNSIVEMYERLNVELCKDIIARLATTKDIKDYTRVQLLRLKKRGGESLFLEALNKTNRLTKKRKKYIYEYYKQVAKKEMEENKVEYEYRNKDLVLTQEQVKILKYMAKLTNKEMQNYTKTIAFATQQEFVDNVDYMYQQVVTGGMDFSTVHKQMAQNLAKKGIQLTMKNGKNRSIEAAVRQNVIYGIRQTAQAVEDDLINYLGADAVEFNISPNCRPSHHPINGRIYSLDKKNKKYPYFSKKLESLLEDYGCNHYKSPFIIGVSEPLYDEAIISYENTRTVKYQGENIPYYKATQKQRALEREIRNAKKEYLIFPDGTNEVKEKEKELLAFLQETKLYRDKDREYFAGYDKIKISNKNML